MIKNVHWSSCKVPVILVRFSWHLNFVDTFSKNTQVPNFTKIRPVGAELFHADRRTDMTKLTVAFCGFANVPTNECKPSSLLIYPTAEKFKSIKKELQRALLYINRLKPSDKAGLCVPPAVNISELGTLPTSVFPHYEKL